MSPSEVSGETLEVNNKGIKLEIKTLISVLFQCSRSPTAPFPQIPIHK